MNFLLPRGEETHNSLISGGKETMARFCVFVIATLLLTYSLHRADGPPLPHPYKTLYATILKAHGDKNISGLHYALLTGDKSKMRRKTRESFRKLFLLHFLTPSGLHLGFIISLLCFFNRKLLWLTPALFFLDGFYAAKRILFLFYLGHLKLNRVWVFFVFFALDFLFGSFVKNPLSFSLSFLFLGVIYTAKKYHSLFFPFMAAQILVSFFLEQTFSLSGFTMGLLLTPLLIASFPLYLTGFHEGTKILCRFTLDVIEGLGQWAHYDATFVGLILVSIPFLFLWPYPLRGRALAVSILLSLHSNDLINLRSTKHLQFIPSTFRPRYTSIKRTLTGYRTTEPDGTRCYFRLRNFSYEADCR